MFERSLCLVSGIIVRIIYLYYLKQFLRLTIHIDISSYFSKIMYIYMLYNLLILEINIITFYVFIFPEILTKTLFYSDDVHAMSLGHPTSKLLQMSDDIPRMSSRIFK